MMKSRPSLKNSARYILSLALTVLASLLFLAGCSPTFTPTYPKEAIDKAVQDICKNEYHIEVKTKLLNETLWTYLPLENLFEKAKKPDKITEKFTVEYNQDDLREGVFRLRYIVKPIPDRTKLQEFSYNKDALEKVNSVWKVLRRVIFSMGRSKTGEPKFFCLVAADIKNGFEIREIFYSLDLKKVSYDFISWTEYQHRAIQETGIAPEIIGDKEGLHVNYTEITLQDFICKQIEQRIRLKFQKPEVDKTVDIDNEILKIAAHTVRIYDFKDFDHIEFSNLFSNKTVVLSREELWARPLK